MADKVISIYMNLMMIFICTSMLVVFQFTYDLTKESNNVENAYKSVINAEGEVKSSTDIVLRGDEVLGTLLNIIDIDYNRRSIGKSELFIDYNIYYNGTLVGAATNVRTLVDVTRNYKMTYNMSSKTITIVNA